MKLETRKALKSNANGKNEKEESKMKMRENAVKENILRENVNAGLSESYAWLIKAEAYGRNMAAEWFADFTVALPVKGLGEISKAGFKEILASLCKNNPEMSKEKLAELADAAKRFAFGMEENDFVLFADKDKAYIGLVESGYLYKKEEEGKKEGLPQQRKLKPLRALKRSSLSRGLDEALCTAGNVVRLTPYRDEIAALAFCRDLTAAYALKAKPAGALR